MNKIIGSVENWEDGSLGTNIETAQPVDDGMVDVNIKISQYLDFHLENMSKEMGMIKKALIRKILLDYISGTHPS